MLSVSNLSCGYAGEKIINDISFEISGGEIVSITGPNGSGKSTLLRAICGIIPSYTGEILLDSENILTQKRSDIAKKISFLSQLNSYDNFADFSVYDTVMLGRFPHKKLFSSSKNDAEIVENCLRMTDVFSLKEKLISTLSGGQLQRVFLARAFAQEPKIILLDEPSNHLDIKHRLRLLELLKNWKSDDKIVISIFHDLSLATYISDRIILLDKGEILLDNSPSDFCKSEKLSDVYDFNVREFMNNSSNIWK